MIPLPRVGHAVIHLKRGEASPGFALNDRTGAAVTPATLRQRPAVLIFGEAYHEKTREAWGTIELVLQDERLAAQLIISVLVTSEESRPEDLKRFLGGRAAPLVTRDSDRRAFGAFRVAAMPSVVVLDRDGRIVHAVAGPVPRLRDILTDSLLYACGKLSAERLEEALNPPPTTQPTAERVRADRVASLAAQLVRRGLLDLAAEKYQEAIELNPRQTEARLGLANLLLHQRRLPEAEAHFRGILGDQPDSTPAALGLAYIQTLRGGSELDQAEKDVRAVLTRHPAEARAHYLLGLIHEQRAKPGEAASSFRKAAELLMERHEQE